MSDPLPQGTPIAFACPQCSFHAKVARDYLELNAEHQRERNRLSYALRELRKKFDKIDELLSAMRQLTK